MPSYYYDNTTGQRVEIKKTHRVRNFVVFPLLGLFAVIVLGTAIAGGGSTSPSAPVTPGSPSVSATPAASAEGVSTVEIEGSGEAMVSITTGGTSTNTVKLPHTAELPEGFAVVVVSRSPSVESYMEGSPDTAEIRCRIVRDGKVVDEQAASGEFAAATCTKYM